MTDLEKLLQMDSVDNISDELLAAYIDGNTIPIESMLVQNAAELDPNIAEVIDLTSDMVQFSDFNEHNLGIEINSLLKSFGSPDSKLDSNKVNFENFNKFL